MAEFRNFLRRIIEILNNLQIKYVVVGGVAIIISGRPRTTTDLDLIIERNETKYWQLMDKLEQADFDVMREQAKQAFQENSNLSIFDKKSFLHIDLRLAKQSYELEVLDESRIVAYGSLRIKIPTIEQILFGKVLYLGNIERIPDKELLEFNDVLDFIIVFNIKKDQINHDLLHQKVETAGFLTTLKRLLKLAQKF